MAEQPSLIRQWIVLRMLSALRGGTTVKEMAAETGVNQKTIRRDLETFQTVGFPLSEVVETRGRKKWRLDPDRTQPGMAFTFDEAIALYLGRRFLEPLAGTVFWDAAQRAFAKLRSSLTPSALKYIDRFAAVFHQTAVGCSDYSQQAELLDRLVQAVEERRIAIITYRSLRATEPVSYDIYPYGLTYHRGSLYLVGHAPDHNAIRHWKVDRVREVELSDLRFNRPADFDLQSHFAKSFGVFRGDGSDDIRVRVRFSSTVARYVSESRWHASQKLTPEKDGSLLAEFVLDGVEEISRWLLSFGRHVVVLEPEELVREMTDEVKGMLCLLEERTSDSASATNCADNGPAKRREVKSRSSGGQGRQPKAVNYRQ